MPELISKAAMKFASNYYRAVSNLVIAALFLLLALPVDAQQKVPALNARVTDLTGTLTSTEQDQLEQKLAALEKQKGSQIFILIVPTTAPEAIEQYSIRVVDQWKVGRKSIDDGVLLLIAKNDRTLRFEVGRGLEGVLTDVTTHRITDEFITPEFKVGNFAGGINSGVDAIVKLINGEPLPPPENSGHNNPESAWPILVFIGLGFTGALRQLFGKEWGGAIAGILSFLIVAYISSIVVGILIGILFFVLTYAGAISSGGPGTGSWSTGSSGWGGGSFGGGGGGFSGGGGGSFGGGGSTGRW